MNEDIVWKAMFEADVHRRYYGQQRDRLVKTNRRILVGVWGTSLVAAVLSAVSVVPASVSVGFLIIACGLTTLRDILHIPERLASIRFMLMGANDEYDKMRLIWDGDHEISSEYQSYHRMSMIHNQSSESTNAKMFEAAEKASNIYHTKLIERSPANGEAKSVVQSSSTPGASTSHS